MPRRSPKGETEVAIYERRQKVLEMRREGKTFQAIADSLGFHDASHASRDYHMALKQIIAPEAEAVRAEGADRLQFLYEQQMKVVLDPPLQHSAIGKPIPHPVRPGEYLVNESVRNSAIKNAVSISSEYMKLFGVPLLAQPDPQAEKEYQETVEWVRSLAERNRQLEAELARLRGQEPPVFDAEIVTGLEEILR